MKHIWLSGDTKPQPQQPQAEQTIRIEAPLLSDQGPDVYVRSSENVVYFYSEVNSFSCAEASRILSDVDLKLQYAKNVVGENYVPTIHLRVNSGGGNLLDGLALLDRIRTLKSEVHTYVEGGVASAATFLTVVGKRRYIGKHSMMLIHQLSAFNSGNFEQLEDGQINYRRFMGIIKDVYKEYTKIPMKKLDEILKHDIWLSSKECLEYGLVDEIL